MLSRYRIEPGGGGGRIPGGGCGGAPTGGIPRPIPGGIGGIPGGIGIPGGAGIRAVKPTDGIPRPCGVMAAAAGPPTPRTAPTTGGTTTAGIPRPAGRPNPGPGMTPGTRGRPSSGGGGPSTVKDTIFWPRSNTNPSTRFSSLSMPLVPFPRILRNSSHSDSMTFMCLSNALNVPMNIRLSCSITLIL
ncbi:hypothetical protein DERP_004388 [Dermatophagoides pteronyssinus]|uniref:Uncharacterized protein n=1 Tax=Dermatophagoides pteronyssinus TaxID=6956 RepID=A0ABQ8JNM4_DERPT|nr:hypothetical protein DERP_004388 [Dermatophagoides pteronyssinus]